MIIQLNKNIKPEDKNKIISELKTKNYSCSEVKTMQGNYLVAIGKAEIDIRQIGVLKGVADIHKVSDNYKLVSRKWKTDYSEIDLGNDIKIGSNNFSIMAGPCSIENEEQIIEMVKHLKANNVKIMRGGVFKPRSSPYSFRGLGIEGLKVFSKHCKEAGIKIITEVMQVSQIEDMIDYVDIFQVGARNSQNFNLLDELGKTNKPVMLKRGLAGTIDELLFSAEYIFSAGNEQIILCERGIRSYEKAYRNTLDINAIPILKEKSHLPVIVDPSHAIGIRQFIEPLALASIMAGADGIIFEMHKQPEIAFSDGQQSLNYAESEKLYKNIRKTYDFRSSLS
ncbi:MAG: 3-deoxy-7-phosphoheptulonate synthase [Chlorobi bacterium]|nr:3-deoxy-7-phosphoheptulonate synthase [Chlorobiota bacterium]